MSPPSTSKWEFKFGIEDKNDFIKESSSQLGVYTDAKIIGYW